MNSLTELVLDKVLEEVERPMTLLEETDFPMGRLVLRVESTRNFFNITIYRTQSKKKWYRATFYITNAWIEETDSSL